MPDTYSTSKRALAGWIWNCARTLDFHTVFCPFTGWPSVPVMFKEQGKGVVTAGLLESYAHLGRALVENSDEFLDAFDADLLLQDNPERAQRVEGVCNAYNMAPAHGAWLDNLRANIDRLDGPLKQSMAMAAGLRVIRYLLSFDDATRDVRPDQDTSGVFQYYVESMNQKVFDGGEPCEAHMRDAFELVRAVSADAMYFYLPSAAGYLDLSPEERIMELFVTGCIESELDARLAGRAAGLGTPAATPEEYADKLRGFLAASAHIPLWFAAFNENAPLDQKRIADIFRECAGGVEVLEQRIAGPHGGAAREYLIIAQR